MAVVAALCSLVGCSRSGYLTEQEVATYLADGAALEAATMGVVVRDRGCVYIENDGYRTLPIFPSTSVSWDGEVLTFGGKQYRQGDRIVLGGGESGPPGRFRLPGSCDPGVRTWLVAPPRS